MAQIERIQATDQDDTQLQTMIDDCNALIDQYNGLGNQQNSDAGQALWVQIRNFKNRIAKIRRGY